MSNNLYRQGSTYTIPAVPAVLPVPAYTSYETVPVVTQQPPQAPPGWGYKAAVDQSTGQQTIVLMYLGTQPATPGSGVSTALPNPTYTTTYVTRATYHEAVPGSPGSPSVRIDNPPRGWTSFANSVASIPAQGYGQWSVLKSVVGVAIGLTPNTAASVGYGHITHGLLFSGGTVRNLITSASYGTYVSADVFKMEVKPQGITFYKNSTSIGTEANDMGITPLFLAAVLNASGDEVDTPSLAAYSIANGNTVMRMLTGMSAVGAHAEGQTVMQPLTSLGWVGSHGDGVMQGLASAATDRVYADALTTMQGMNGFSYGGTLVLISNNIADTTMNALIGQSLGLTGSLATANTFMQPAFSISANKLYIYSQGVMQPMRGVAGWEPADEAYMTEVVGVRVPVSGAMELLVTMMAGVVVSTTVVSSRLIEQLMYDTVHVTSSWATTQVMEALMYAIIHTGFAVGADGPGIASTDSDTWVVNMDNMGSTTYTNFGFNSFAQQRGRYYGANENGVYLLDGDTDDGAPIRASASFGTVRFSKTEKKTVETCYLGMSGEGNLFVKIIAEGHEYIYKTRNFGPELKQQRVTPGKGLRTNYVTLEVYNEDGCDFEIDTVKFMVADMKRRI